MGRSARCSEGSSTGRLQLPAGRPAGLGCGWAGWGLQASELELSCVALRAWHGAQRLSPSSLAHSFTVAFEPHNQKSSSEQSIEQP